MGVPVLDGIFFFAAYFIGYLLWTWPLIYVYWGREFLISLRHRSIIPEDDDEYEEDEADKIEQYFTASRNGTK